jgi:hypothetical protein
VTPLFVAWGISAGILILSAIVLGIIIGRGYLGILIDTRGRYSLSHLQIVLWTFVVFSLISGVFFGRLVKDAQTALDFTIPDELLIVVGISVVATATSSVIKTQKDLSHPETIAASNADDRPRFGQIFLLEEGEFADKAIDVAKFQNFWITLILIVAYVALAIGSFKDLTSPEEVTALPGFAGTFVILLGVSHAGYLAGKLPDRPGQPSGLTLQGLRQGAVPLAAPAATQVAPATPSYVPRNPATSSPG